MIIKEKKYKVLIVEDELKLQKAISDKVVREGWLAINASNGEEGLRAALKDKPDIVLLDIIMPVMDGLTMLKELRKKSNMPVLILTNLYDENKLIEAFRAGSYDYLVKANYSLNEVIDKIREVLEGVKE
ncbi:MAG: response regulator [Candidatus Falkowbacteria bacterium]|nr:response regulator [Candidatus Falkowbacteria bacterium]